MAFAGADGAGLAVETPDEVEKAMLALVSQATELATSQEARRLSQTPVVHDIAAGRRLACRLAVRSSTCRAGVRVQVEEHAPPPGLPRAAPIEVARRREWGVARPSQDAGSV